MIEGSGFGGARVVAQDRSRNAESIADLTGLALAASDVPTAVAPILNILADRTVPAGSASFQSDLPKSSPSPGPPPARCRKGQR